MTCGRYISKCKHEEITDNVFALGGMSPAFIEHKTGCICKAFLFQQIQMNRDIINSKSYLNISRGNSYTVLVEDVGFAQATLYIKLLLPCPNVSFCTDDCTCRTPHYFGIADFYIWLLCKWAGHITTEWEQRSSRQIAGVGVPPHHFETGS